MQGDLGADPYHVFICQLNRFAFTLPRGGLLICNFIAYLSG